MNAHLDHGPRRAAGPGAAGPDLAGPERMDELDPRVARGMALQLEARHARLAAGERPLGWKLGFCAPAAMERLGISRPLVGFLMEGGRVEDGGACAVGRLAKPMLEPEVAVHLGRDLGAGAGREEARAAIAALGAAIEIVDLDPQLSDVEEILAGNIFQRHVVLGTRRAGASLEGATGRVLVDGEEVARTADPQALTGELVSLVQHTADLLAAVGERLRAGDVLIAGAIVPALPAEPGRRVSFELDPIGGVEIGLSR
ncbi:MAG: fumarylacetoacetate hydrolase family protein [Thermoleophilaceae bacterium]|nr:fumarylacetoacetate hydrolase family protein [Thermoleophilaceae bacterium]